MTISKAQITILHVAKSKLAMDDDTCRSVLAKCAGVTSSTELDVAGFAAVMGFFEYCGFTPRSATGANYSNRDGMATYTQLELIRTLWLENHPDADAGRTCDEQMVGAVFQSIVVAVPDQSHRAARDHGVKVLEIARGLNARSNPS